jgi:predicted ATP-dependent serine protease
MTLAWLTMARRNPTFICQNGGTACGRRQGNCDACGKRSTQRKNRQ